jgi:hypothetical protein
MTTRSLRALLATLALVSAAFTTAVVTSAPASASEWCVNTTASSYDGHEITPAGEYCVPGP